MEQITGTNVQVVLSLKEGKGFDKVANSTCLVATLDGQSLQTDCVEPDANPQYSTDLVWKTDKNLLRKMRSSQEPLRIECFEMKNNGKRDKVGYTLLSLRTARIVPPRDENVRIEPSWHRLLGLRNDVKAWKPELLLALTIEEHESYVRRISQQEALQSKEKHQSFHTTSQKPTILPHLIEEENIIQLGPLSTCQSLYLLQITAETAQNLHLLKPEKSEYPGANYRLWYRILENDVQLQTFDTLKNTWILNEKVIIRIRSSHQVLKNYLEEQPNIMLILQHKETILSHCEIDLRPLLSVETPGETPSILNKRCVLTSPKTPRIGDDDNSAFMDLQLRLICVESKKSIDPPEIYRMGQRSQTSFSDIKTHRNPCGDFSKCIGRCRSMNPLISGDSRIPNDRVPLARSINTCSRGDRPGSVEAYHCYCLNINLIGIKLTSTIRNIEFRFHHPKAEIMSTVHPKMPLSRDEKLRLQDIGCKLHFISAANEIRQLLMNFPPKISVCDASNEKKTCLGQTILDVGLLFRQDKLEAKYEAVLCDAEKKTIGTIDVVIYLEDHGPYYKTYQRSGENLGPPIIDDSLAYKIVEELETWKERQQEIFRIELKRKEDYHLNRLSEEWQKRRENLESRLASSVEHCKMLAKNLNTATEDLRTRRLMSLEKEARLVKANEELEWRYEKNVQESHDAMKRMQEEFASKIKILEEQKNNLEVQVEPLRLENERLRHLTSKQSEEIEGFQKGSLTQDQTASLLQEVKNLEQKLANTQKDKSYFKELWGKAVREIHRMRTEHQQAIEVQIKTSKEELKNFNLDDFLCADSTALTNDQILLGQIQKEIDVIKPRSYARPDSSSQQIFGPIESLYVQHGTKTNRDTAKSDEQGERLRMLIEERDALLKTGSYTIDDVVMIKLNTEIRSLLTAN